MARKEDPHFDIAFYESVLKRDSSYVDVIELLGGLYTKTGRIADGLKMDRKLVRLQPRNAMAHYNLACSLCLSKRPGDAMKSLRRAIELGYDDHEWMANDPDLEPLRSNQDFQDMLTLLRSLR